MRGGDEVRTAGLRERKKQQTRQSLLDAARRLFEERGYDNVTVAEIADAAGTSVKTMFTHFRSKEDLAFGGQAQLLGELVGAVEGRGARLAVVDAVADALRAQLADVSAGDVLSGLLGYHRGYGESPALQNGLRRMWADYEDALTAAVTRSEPDLAPAEARLQAMRAVLLVRSVTTAEVRDLIQSADNPRGALLGWIEHAARSLEPLPRLLLRGDVPAASPRRERG